MTSVIDASPPRRLMTFVLIALAIASPFLLMALFIDNWSRDLSTNTAATAPDHEDARLRPVEAAGDEASVRDALDAFVAGKKAWAIVNEKPLPTDSPLRALVDGDPTAVHLVRSTSLMGYKDDVWLAVEDLDESRIRLHGDSRSRVGKGDLGQNPRNLDELLTALREQL